MTSTSELVLQRILDDDSDSGSRKMKSTLIHQQHIFGKQQQSSFHIPAHFNPISRLSSITMDTDIERILRETDEDEDSSRDLNISLTPAPLYGIDNESLEGSSNSSSLQTFELVRHPNNSQYKLKSSSLTTSSNLVPSNKSFHLMKASPDRQRSADEWTLLQKILDEHEDDDLSHEDVKLDSNLAKRYTPDSKTSFSIPNVTSNTYHIQPLRKSSSSFLTDVDVILENLDDDDDDDDESDAAAIAELDDLASRFQSIHASSKLLRNESLQFRTKIDSFLDSSIANATASSQDVKQRDTSMSTSPVNPAIDIYRKSPIVNRVVSCNTKAIPSNNTASLNTMSLLNDAISSAAMKYAESYEQRLLRPSTRDIISPLMIKRRMKPKIEIPTKSRLNKMGSSVIQNPIPPRFNFAGVIENKIFPKISSRLSQNAQEVERVMGLPTALAVNSKFIAIGTQEGFVLIFDHFEELRQRLGLSAYGTNLIVHGISVTSLDLSTNGETLIAGYSNGAIILWDIIKGSVLKSVTDLHPSPITVCRFVSDQFMNVVTIDAGGLVNRVVFSKTIWSSVGIESECLLDGSAGQILAMHILPSFNSLKGTPSYEGAKGSISHPSHRKLVLMALSSDRSSFAVAIEPKIHVLHRWPRPTSKIVELNKDENSNDCSLSNPFLPCLAWGWVLISGGENIVTPILARSWGCSLQFLRAIFPPLEEANRNSTDDNNSWPAFGLHDEFDATDPIVALEWLGDRSLMYLTITNEFIVCDSVMMTLTERLDFSGIKLVYAEIALSRSLGNNEKFESRMSTTFLNSVRTSDERILILCREELRAVSILDIHKRVQSLENDGEWLEALALALDHYESSVKSQEDRKRDPDGKRDLMNHPEFLPRLRFSEDDEWLADLLRRYLYLAVENAPESNPDPLNTSARNRVSSARQGLLNTHFQMLAGVCIEFCVVSRRLDQLYGEIFDKFHKSGNSSIFFEVLEPYIMNDKLKYVTAEVMAQFVNHCKMNHDLSTFERCLLHLDVTIMDFDSCVTLLRKNSMHSALVHVYTAGLDDYITPLQVLYEDIFDNCELIHSSSMRSSDGAPANLFHQYGYKAILYIRHCLQGRTFPRGDPLKPDDRLETLRPQVLFFLIRSEYTPLNGSGSLIKNLKDNVIPLRESKYPYLRALMLLDPKAVFDSLTIVFDNPVVRFIKSLDILNSADDWNHPVLKYDEQCEDKFLCPDRQDTARILSLIMNDLTSTNALVPHTTAFNYFYEFLYKYLLQGVIWTPKSLTTNVFSRICNKVSDSEHLSSRKETEQTAIRLLQNLPSSSFDIDEILCVFEQSKFTRAALFLHKTGVHNMSHGSSHFMSVINCYLQEDDPSFKREVFKYIKDECTRDSASVPSKFMADRDILRAPLLSNFPALVQLDAIRAASLVSDIYLENLDMVLQTLDHGDGLLLYRFLENIINGELTKVDPNSGSLLLSNLTLRNYQRYLELMAKYHPENVYRYLQTHENYRLDECLKLCQSHDIPDASAYILERLGNVSSALQLLLQTLEGRLMSVKRKVRGLNLHSHSSGLVSPQECTIRLHLDAAELFVDLMKTREYQSTKMILDATLDLCERNSKPSGVSRENGSQLWLNVVDRLLNAKGFLRLQKEKPEHSQTLLQVVMALLHTSLQRVIKRVPLSDLIHMITSEHATHRLGDLREMITAMLNVYGSEANIYSEALNAIQENANTMTLLKHDLKRRATKTYVRADRNVNVLRMTDCSIRDYNYLSQILLNINCEGDVVILKGKYSPMETPSHQIKNGRAKLNTNHRHLASFGVHIKTKSDDLFYTETVRHSGMLGGAEHFGRLA